MFWDLCGTVSPVISCSTKLWLYFPAGNIIKASGVFFGIVEDTASLQKTFKKRESSKLPHPVFNRSFAVKWRFCVPFLALTLVRTGKQNLASCLPHEPWKAVHRLPSASFCITSRFSLLADCGPNPQARIRQAD